MNILYAIQGTGNGHISRAMQLHPYLKQVGNVDYFLSGCNYTLPVNLPVKYRSKGLSLHYKACGSLNYIDIFTKIQPLRISKEINELPVENYDLIINDFDFITSMACRRKKKASVQFGHQASFQSEHTPRPKTKSMVGETVLKKFARSTHYVGLHFKSYDEFIFDPIIKKEILESDPIDYGHITMYLPSYQKHCLLPALRKLKDFRFHWFLPEIKSVQVEGNIVYYPVDHDLFNRSMITCHGVITGGGFETPSEVLYLKKKLMSIPIGKHYEQLCNSVALQELGVKTLSTVDDQFGDHIRTWMQEPKPRIEIKANSMYETLNYLLDLTTSEKSLTEVYWANAI